MTFNLDPAQLESVITPQSKAIIPVHLFGQAADMDPILDIAQRYNLHVIEDAAQAIGAEYKGRRAGSMGHLGCFSFFPSKNLGGFGDGGMVTTNDARLAQQVRLLRNHGHQPKYYNQVIGGNFRLDAIQAAVLRVKFKCLDAWTAARQQCAATYRRLFAEAGAGKETGSFEESLTWSTVAEGRRHVYNQFVIRCARRDGLIARLRQRSIGTAIYYPLPLHLQECFAYLGYRAGDFPESEKASIETLALPIYPELTESMQARVVQVVVHSCCTRL